MIKEWLTKNSKNAVAWRRQLHKCPQTNWTEYYATGFIIEKLSGWGYSLQYGRVIHSPERRGQVPCQERDEDEFVWAIAAGANENLIAPCRGGWTGVIADMDSGRLGPAVAMRFDIDGLSILESSSCEHLPQVEGFRSIRDGFMHACGHDGHAACGLLLAKWFSEQRDQWSGKIRLIFQPAEEGGCGGGSMAAAGAVDGFDYFFAGHIISGRNDIAGKIAIDVEEILANRHYEVKYTGQAAHAAINPEGGRNALLAACNAAINLYAISRHGQGSTFVNVGHLQAGRAHNVIADNADMVVEVRGDSNETCEYMAKRAKEVIAGTARIYDVQCEIIEGVSYISARNSKQLLQLAAEVAANVVGEDNVLERYKMSASEDVTFYMQRVIERGGQALFVIFTTTGICGHHNQYFDFKEDVILTAAEWFIEMHKKLL